MTRPPDPDSLADTYSEGVDSDRVERHRERQIEAIQSDSEADDGPLGALKELTEKAASEIHSDTQSFAEFLRPAIWDVAEGVDDTYTRGSYDFDTVVAAVVYFIAREDLDSWHDLEVFLKANPETASELGFHENIPDHTTFSRTWNDRFKPAFRDHLRHIAQRETLKARKHDIPVPDGLTVWADDEAEPDPKRITQNQKKEAIRNIRPLVFDQLDFDRAQNAHYHRETLLDLYAEVSRETDYLNKTSEDRRAEGENVPWSQTVLNATQNREAAEWEDEFRDVFDTEIEAAKGAGLLDRPVPVAIDTTIRPYYVQNRELPDGARGGEPKNGTYYGYHHTTISAQVNGRSVLLASYQFTPDGSHIDAIEYLIERAEKHVSIDEVTMDSAFASKAILEYLDGNGYDFIVQRARRGNELKRKLVAMTGRYDESTLKIGESGSNTKSKPFRLVAEPDWDNIEDEEVLNRMSDEDGQMGIENYADSDRVSVDLNEVPKAWWECRRAYLTNIEDLDPEYVVNRYDRRWQIETKYRVIKQDFLGKTTSRSFAVRTFFWLFAAMMYNAWVLLDVFLRADADDGVELPDDRPVMPARSFARRFLTLDYG